MSVLCLDLGLRPRPPTRCIVHVDSCLQIWLLTLALTVTYAAQDTPQEVEVVKQINRVNDDGSYTYGYEAADGSFKIETRDVVGNVKGMFGFIDETGELKRVSYTANNGTGFKTSGEESLTRQDPSRAPVIQHIPRRSTTTPLYGEYLRGRRPADRDTEPTASTTPQVTEEPEHDRPTHIPLRKLLVTKRPSNGRGGNNLRRQLVNDSESPSGDVADVYTGAGGSPRYIPAQSVRSPQSSLLANLPPHVAAAIRQQQLARAAAALRPYSPTSEPYPAPVPSPRPAVIDEQEFPPVRGRTRALYRNPDDDAPIQFPFPMTSLRSLRDELMDYILQYLQYRLGGGSPYFQNPFPPFQNQFPNPNFPYQNPINFQGGNPNVYNPYVNPNTPYLRNPYQPPPFGPLGYGPVGYPPVGYPGQGFPQPLPFSSPNKQAAQQYGPSQRSVPAPTSATSYEQAETQTSYSLPSGDVLRMMLARGLATSTTAAPSSVPVRSVQILGAASSVSSTTVRPPVPVDEMEMQA